MHAYCIGIGTYTVTIESVAADGTVLQSVIWAAMASPGENHRGSIQMFEDGAFLNAPHNLIPEIPLGTIMVSAVMIIALTAYKLRRKREQVNL